MTQPAAPAGESKSQQAYNWISERIRTRDYEPGYRLVLATIADELGISVVPVREAIRQLEAEGMVTYERNVGASVTTYNREAYYESMDIVATVEANATAQSAPYLNAEDIARAREINQRMRELDIHHDPEEFTQLNKEFHSVLFSKCPNERLKDLVVDQWKQLEYHRVSTFRYVPERAQESTREHEQLVSLIEAGAEPAYIEKVARQHRLSTLNTYRKKND
ncbi:GntR family transcriptional regulator [Corynebacterium sp. HMSC034H07]|uniref:GntR family transcriptional regulator n=1 Tax=Corynebacterium sp. HMSC034H07 TaxID=1739512 RepID=UPI0008A572ED|nr:GntR family transcriptional regulator [Corynebacterium sp. HMSC034H07]OFO94226.1 GntR family transcriptional regulator [Corynebacterium sp. HMSC034H07]